MLFGAWWNLTELVMHVFSALSSMARIPKTATSISLLTRRRRRHYSISARFGTSYCNCDIGAIRHELLQLLGVPVDVLTPKALPERFREAVLSEAVPV
jgi:hypothetical protein